MYSLEEYLSLYEVRILISLYKLEMQSREVGKLKDNPQSMASLIPIIVTNTIKKSLPLFGTKTDLPFPKFRDSSMSQN